MRTISQPKKPTMSHKKPCAGRGGPPKLRAEMAAPEAIPVIPVENRHRFLLEKWGNITAGASLMAKRLKPLPYDSEVLRLYARNKAVLKHFKQHPEKLQSLMQRCRIFGLPFVAVEVEEAPRKSIPELAELRKVIGRRVRSMRGRWIDHDAFTLLRAAEDMLGHIAAMDAGEFVDTSSLGFGDYVLSSVRGLSFDPNKGGEF